MLKDKKNKSSKLLLARKSNCFLANYNKLPVLDQLIIQLLSLQPRIPVSANFISSCLIKAGYQDISLSNKLPQTLQIRLLRLAKSNLVTIADNLPDIQDKLWLCPEELCEVATRHALRDGNFQRLVRALRSEADNNSVLNKSSDTELLREIRLLFYEKDYDSLLKAIDKLNRGSNINVGGHILLDLVEKNISTNWLQAIQEFYLDKLLVICLDIILLSLYQGPVLDFISEYLLSKKNLDKQLLFSKYTEILVCRLDFPALEKYQLFLDNKLGLKGKVAISFLKNHSDTYRLVKNLLLYYRREENISLVILPEITGVFQCLLLLRMNTQDSLKELSEILSSDDISKHEFAEVLYCLRYVINLKRGVISSVESFHQDQQLKDSCQQPITKFFYLLTQFWLDTQQKSEFNLSLMDIYKKFIESGYNWFACESIFLSINANVLLAQDKVVKSVKKSYATYDLFPLVDLFVVEQKWQHALLALADCTNGVEPRKNNVKSSAQRLAWLLEFIEPNENNFIPVHVHPVEQRVSASGSWSKGRSISLKRLFYEYNQLPFLSQQDLDACRTLNHHMPLKSAGFSFDHNQALYNLVGHKFLFRADTASLPVEVEQGDFELVINKHDNGCQLTISPLITEFTSIEDINSFDFESLPDILVKIETPVLVKVYKLTPLLRKVAAIINEGLIIPFAGFEALQEITANLSGNINISSSLQGFLGTATEVEPISTPVISIVPVQDGLRIEAFVQPLGQDGPSFKAGRGSKVAFIDTQDKKLQTVRNFSEEVSLLDYILVKSKTLSFENKDLLIWNLTEPEKCLNFLLEVQEWGKSCIAVWPKGGKIKLLKQRNNFNLKLQLEKRQDWFKLTGTFVVDENTVLSMQQLVQLFSQREGNFIKLSSGDFLALSQEFTEKLADLQNFVTLSGDELKIKNYAFSAIKDLEALGAEVKTDSHWQELVTKYQEVANYHPVVPRLLNAQLRDYQIIGYQWLAKLAYCGMGACLADDMGLGKTVQTLALLLERASLGPALVIAPTSVCYNWLSECHKFSPSLRTFTFTDNNRAEVISHLKPFDLLITSYGLLQQEKDLLSSITWSTVILDEAQAIKNSHTKRSEAAMSLQSDFKMITTGTPIENNLSELWNLFRFINPGLLSTASNFQAKFIQPIEKFNDHASKQRLKQIIKPFILRRNKTDVLDTLPPRTEIILYVEFSDQERAFYEALRREAVNKIEQSATDNNHNRLQILAEIMRLRRACCNPQLITKNNTLDSAKFLQFKETISELLANKHKVLVFSQFIEHLSILREYLEQEKISYQYLDGSTPVKLRKKAVEDFQSGIGEVFLISLRAGGLGLNLTAADYVLHMDPWWNPAVEDQASDRAHRIGQTRPVTIYRFIVKDTIEEKIVKLHQDKKDLADSLLSDSNNNHKVNIEELIKLLKEE